MLASDRLGDGAAAFHLARTIDGYSTLVDEQHYLLTNAAITLVEIILGLMFGALAGILTAFSSALCRVSDRSSGR